LRSDDGIKNFCGCIGSVFAMFLIVAAVLFCIVAITEWNGWFLLAVPVFLLLAFGYYKAFTSE
jgi:hypothetical protein